MVMEEKGIDWTDGCIALTNADMDKLFKCLQNRNSGYYCRFDKTLK